MAGSIYGTLLTRTTWGESHGKGVGVVLDGCPAGLSLCEKDIQPYLDRRRPGQSAYTTKRQEKDQVELLSGVFEGRTTGAPISMLVRNEDQHTADYLALKDVYRPGHADYTFDAKYGGTGWRPARWRLNFFRRCISRYRLMPPPSAPFRWTATVLIRMRSFATPSASLTRRLPVWPSLLFPAVSSKRTRPAVLSNVSPVFEIGRASCRERV